MSGTGAEFPIKASVDDKSLNLLIAHMERAGKAAGMTEDEIRAMNNELKKLGKSGAQSVNDVNGAIDKMVNGTIKRAAQAFGGLFAAQKIIQVGKEIFNLTAQYQKFASVLTNTLGSRSAAMYHLGEIQKFATRTPYQINGLTESFIKLANRGVVATMDEFRALGDLSATLGKDVSQLVEALLDVNNSERWKELGIRSQTAGDKVKLSFRGMTLESARTVEGVTQTAIALGNMKGVAGQMAGISETLDGKWSNWVDNLEQLGTALGTRGSGVIGSFLDFGNSALGSVNKALNDNVVKLQSEQLELNTLVGAITDVNVEEDVRSRLLTELNNKYPDFLKNLDAETVTNEQLRDRLADVNKQFERKILLAAAEKQLAETSEAIVKTVNDEAEARKLLHKSKLEYAKEEEVRQRMAATGQAFVTKAALDAQYAETAIVRAQKERKELQEELTEKLKAYNSALDIFNTTENDYFEIAKKTNKENKVAIGLIEAMEAEIKRVEEAKKKAFRVEDIAKYNDELAVLNARLRFLTNQDYTLNLDLPLEDLEKMFGVDRKDLFKGLESSAERATDRVGREMEKLTEKEKERIEKLNEEHERAEELKVARQKFYVDTVSAIGDEFFLRKQMQFEEELAALESLRAHELEMAGDNAKAKEAINKKFNDKEKALKREQAQRDRDQALFNIGINTAQAIIATLARTPLPAGAPFVALTALAGIIQAGIVISRPLPKFKDGVYDLQGPGTETSDDILARLSAHESVVPAKASKKFGFLLKPLIEDPNLQIAQLAQLLEPYIPTHLRGDLFSAAKSQPADSELLHEVRALRKDMANVQHNHIELDEHGFQKWTRKGSEWNRYVNKRYRFEA
jgi:hypothetical protein